VFVLQTFAVQRYLPISPAQPSNRAHAHTRMRARINIYTAEVKMHARARTRRHIPTCAGPKIKEGRRREGDAQERESDGHEEHDAQKEHHAQEENLMQQKKLNARTTVCYVVGWQMHTGALWPALQTCMHADVEDMAQATCEHIHHCACFHRLVVSLPLFPNLSTHIRH